MQIDSTGSPSTLLNRQKQAQMKLDEALNMQEVFWKEKARVKWHSEGDRNTGYFHRLAKIKNTNKLITSIKVGDTTLQEPNEIAEHITNYFKNLFSSNSFLQVNSLVEDDIPKLISEETNNMLTILLSMEEVRNVVFSLNKEGAPGPDGFVAYFFQTYWSIIQSDVFNAVIQFYTNGWIMPNYNSNTIILIPKVDNAETVEQFRPIALANFKFKIVTKILADRLATIMPFIISEEQRGLIKGRQIKDCILLTSEAANLLHKKAFGGNLAMKIDISKAFDTLDWEFLLKVLHHFGFNQKFCFWIRNILESAYLSVSINGAQKGYFQCKRGVRQGDLYLPSCFVLLRMC